MLRGTDIMLWIIPPFELNMKNIPHTIVNPVGNFMNLWICYGAFGPYVY